MSSYLLAIWSDHNGDPFTGAGRIGHVVRVAPYAGMPLVDEFTDGGAYEHDDCAPACIQSRLLQGGVQTSVRQIEVIAGTGPTGTFFPGIERALRYYGVAEAYSAAAPPAGWIMNPAGGRLISPDAFPAYLAASQGGCIVMADPTGPPTPPPPPPIEEPEMQTIVVPVWTGTGAAPPILVPGVTGSSSLNLVAFGNCQFQIWLWDQDGGSVAERVVTLKGNQPGVVGPVELSGYLYQIFAVPPATGGGGAPAKPGVPYVLGLFPGSGAYSASIH
jgi:hypothetical protein